MDLKSLFNTAAAFARQYNGSEPAYRQFMNAAIAYDEAGGEAQQVDQLLDTAIDALKTGSEDIFNHLQQGGAQVTRHGAVFIRPAPEHEKIIPGEHSFIHVQVEPRLHQVVTALQAKGIYYDDLVIDVGSVGENQMRRKPYVIVTIPRLNAQIAVADQVNEALFVSNPAIPYMNWVLFEKPMAGQAETPFANVKKIIHAGAWQERMMSALFGAEETSGPKVSLPGYMKAQRKTKYPLTEEMIVAMARMYRERHPEKQWPSQKSGIVDHEIVSAVTGDENWQSETWIGINSAGIVKCRGLTRSLSQTLESHKRPYTLSEEMVVVMARMYRERHPEKQWPTTLSGTIDPEIVAAATGDSNWRTETWKNIARTDVKNPRGLTRSLLQILESHGCHYNLSEKIVITMAQLYRERHPEKQWPTTVSGAIDPEIVAAATGDSNWQSETWTAIEMAGHQKQRGLTRSLLQTLESHGCHYNLSEKIVVTMAQLYREQHPEKQWPGLRSGHIDKDIVTAATGDPYWQPETWLAIYSAGYEKRRGLTRKFLEILESHGCHYNLSDKMVVAMARMHRERDPFKKWPSAKLGKIDQDIVTAVTGDKHWQAETWSAISVAGANKYRGLTCSLSKILSAAGCHYNLNDEMIVALARRYRELHPQKQWPNLNSGAIDPDILAAVTGDTHWQAESWCNIDCIGRQKDRGLTKSLSKILDAHCPERGKVMELKPT